MLDGKQHYGLMHDCVKLDEFTLWDRKSVTFVCLNLVDQ